MVAGSLYVEGDRVVNILVILDHLRLPPDWHCFSLQRRRKLDSFKALRGAHLHKIIIYYVNIELMTDGISRGAILENFKHLIRRDKLSCNYDDLLIHLS